MPERPHNPPGQYRMRTRLIHGNLRGVLRNDVVEVDLDRIRSVYLRNALKTLADGQRPTEIDVAFLAAETRLTPNDVWEVVHEQGGTTG